MWLLDNFKPFGRMQRAEFFMRSVLLFFQTGLWLLGVSAVSIGAGLEARAGHFGSMHLQYALMLCFGLLIAYQNCALMLRRVEDTGFNPIFALAAYTIFWALEFLYFSTIPDLVFAHSIAPLPVSWLGLVAPLLVWFVLLILPSAPESMGWTAGDPFGDGSSWADKIKLPTEATAAAPKAGSRQPAPSRVARGARVKAQFGNRPARER